MHLEGQGTVEHFARNNFCVLWYPGGLFIAIAKQQGTRQAWKMQQSPCAKYVYRMDIVYAVRHIGRIAMWDTDSDNDYLLGNLPSPAFILCLTKMSC